MRIKKKIRGVTRWIRSRFTENSAVLLYHRVAEPVNDRFNLCVSPACFEEQMAILSEAGRALSLPDFFKRWKGGALPEGSVCVTFDDGYVDNLEIALPILERFGIPATIFVVTGNLGKAFWWDTLEEIIRGARVIPDVIRLAEPDRDLELSLGAKSREQVTDLLCPIFRRMDPEWRRNQLETVKGTVGYKKVGDESHRRAVSVEELRELARHPLITIGAHTVHHAQLSPMSPEDQRREIGGSAKHLEEILGIPIKAFSYPFGLRGRDFTAETMAAAKACGLECAIAADLDVVTGNADPFAMPRLWIHNWDGTAFRKAMNRWFPLQGKGEEERGFLAQAG